MLIAKTQQRLLLEANGYNICTNNIDQMDKLFYTHIQHTINN